MHLTIGCGRIWKSGLTIFENLAEAWAETVIGVQSTPNCERSIGSLFLHLANKSSNWALVSLTSTCLAFGALTATQALALLSSNPAMCLTSSAGPVNEVVALFSAKAEAMMRARTKNNFILIFDLSSCCN